MPSRTGRPKSTPSTGGSSARARGPACRPRCTRRSPPSSPEWRPDMQITPLSDGEARIPPEMLLDGGTWPAGFLDANGLLPVNFGGFLVRTAEHVVVVDTGFGSG